MYQINKRIEERSGQRPSYVKLNADKAMNHQTISCPITWTGYVNSVEVKIVQKEYFAISANFDFEIYPIEYEYLQGDIIEIIDNYLSILD